jgi:small ligand-binding sensory domain FIST
MAEAASDDDRRLMEGGLLIGRVISEYKDRFGRGDFLIRNIVGADEQQGFIAIADLVRVGQTVQFHVRDARAAEEDLRLLLEAQRLHGPAAGAVLCTCNGRGSNMFPRPNVESALISDALGHAPMAGFFAAGEIGPVGAENFLHGFTSSLAVFRAITS